MPKDADTVRVLQLQVVKMWIASMNMWIQCEYSVNTCKTGVWERTHIHAGSLKWAALGRPQRDDHRVCPKHAVNNNATMQQCKSMQIIRLFNPIAIYSILYSSYSYSPTFLRLTSFKWPAKRHSIFSRYGSTLLSSILRCLRKPRESIQLKTTNIKAYQGAANKETALLGSVLDAAAEIVN